MKLVQVFPYIASKNAAKLNVLYNHHGNINAPGENGENVTILVIMLNRGHFTLRLLRSLEEHIPNFAGNILIFDNASTKETQHDLQSFIDNYKFPVKLILNPKNLGTSNARNKAVELVTTPWFLSLDNDIYFVKNLFPILRQAYLQTLAHFINISMYDSDGKSVFSMGGVLALTETPQGLSAGSFQPQACGVFTIKKPPKFFFSDFVFGGAALYMTQTFRELGGFDERYFICYEDLEFSLRVGIAGRSIANITDLCLVHDHSASISESDKSYELLRHSKNHIDESIKRLEEDYGIVISRISTNNWLLSRKVQLRILQSGRDERTQLKVYLVVRNRYCAVVALTEDVMASAPDALEYQILYSQDYRTIFEVLLACSDADLVHFFDGYDLYRSLRELKTENAYVAGSYGLSYKELILAFLNKIVLTTGIYDAVHINNDFAENMMFAQLFQHYIVTNKHLFQLYSKTAAIPPARIIYQGVRLRDKQHALRAYPAGRPMRIGCVKNSKNIASISTKFMQEKKLQDSQSKHIILEVAAKQLQIEGYSLELICQDNSTKVRQFQEMHDFYNYIDIYISGPHDEASSILVLEAMESGLPIIFTTAEGVPEVFGPLQSKYVIAPNETKSFYQALKQLLDYPNNWLSLSQENLKEVVAWERQNFIHDYHAFFQESFTNPQNTEFAEMRKRFFIDHLQLSLWQKILNLLMVFLKMNRIWDMPVLCRVRNKIKEWR